MTREPVLEARPGSAAWQEVDGEVVLLALASQTYLGLNPTAARLWRALETGATHTALVELLVNDFEVSRDDAARDIGTFLDTCRRHGLVDG